MRSQLICLASLSALLVYTTAFGAAPNGTDKSSKLPPQENETLLKSPKKDDDYRNAGNPGIMNQSNSSRDEKEYNPFVAELSCDKEIASDKFLEGPPKTEKPVAPLTKESGTLLKSPEVDYHTQSQTVVAQGGALLYDGERLLSADKLTYNKSTDTATAEGNAWLYEPSGDFTFGPFAEFVNRFEDGYINDPRVIMSDDSRLAANHGKRIHGQKHVFRQAVYSPCNVCKKTPEKPPLWQMKADKTIHSVTDKIIIYHHVRMEFFGVPVLYPPYFRHADPTVKRKSGFLMPTYGTTSDLGAMVSLPYFYAISDNRDLTLIPIITAKQGPVLSTVYRHRLVDGEYKLSGSVTKSRDIRKNPSLPQQPARERWHIFADGRYDLNDEHLFTFDINRASDTTYLRRYPVLNKGSRLKAQIKNLASTVTVEQFKDTNYAMIRGISLQTDNPKTTPTVYPQALYSYQSMPGHYGDIFTADGNLLVLSRTEEIPGHSPRDLQRASIRGGWEVPYLTDAGHVWRARLSARADGYSVHGYTPQGSSQSGQFKKGRLFPQASVDWRYPLYSPQSWGIWTVEPMAMFVTAAEGGNSVHFPNEDCLNSQIDDSSLFLPNRLTGLDKVDSGTRFIYGIRSGAAFPGQRRLEIFLGQSKRLDRQPVLGVLSGEDQSASDLIGRIKFRPTNWMNVLFRTALNRKTKRPRIAETTAHFGRPILNLAVTHTYLSRRATPTNEGVAQVNWRLASQPVQNWSFGVGETRNLKKHQRGPLSRTISAIYTDECFVMTISAFKTAYFDKDIKPVSGVLLQLDFRNLGSFAPLSFLGLQTDNVI